MILDLFLTFMFIGAFSFGGGFAMLPLIQQELVVRHEWLSLAQFTDIVALAGIAPGAVAINVATYSGFRLAGLPGAIAAQAGVVLPSFLLMVAVAGIVIRNKDNIYFNAAFRGLRPVVVALIIGAAVLIGETAITGVTDALIAAAVLALLRLTHVHPVLLILGAGLCGVLIY